MKISTSTTIIWGFALLCLVFNCGCPTEKAPVIIEPQNAMSPEEIQALANRPLKVLAVGPEEWAEELTAQYSGRFDSKIEVSAESHDAFVERNLSDVSGYDVVIVPPGVVAGLAEDNLLYEIRPESYGRFNEASLLTADRDVSRYENKCIGVSLGAPLRMVFHSDSQAAANYLASDQSWANWHELAVDSNRETLQYVEPLSGTGAAESLLARGGAYARSRTQVAIYFNRSNGEPRISSTPFVTALDELKEEYGNHVDRIKSLSEREILTLLKDGQLSAAILPLQNLSMVDWPVSEEKSAEDKVIQSFDGSAKSLASTLDGWSVAQVPYSHRYFNLFSQEWSDQRDGDSHRYHLIGLHGRVACITKQSRKTESALRLLELLSNSPTAESLAGFGEDLGPAKFQQLEQLPQWFGKAYSADSLEQIRRAYELADESQGASLIRFPSIDGQSDKLMMLNQAVLDVLEGKITSEAALQRCAKQWVDWDSAHQNRTKTLISKQ